MQSLLFRLSFNGFRIVDRILFGFVKILQTFSLHAQQRMPYFSTRRRKIKQNGDDFDDVDI